MLNVQAKTASTRNSVATIFIFSVAALESYWWQDKVYYTKPMSKIIVLIARKGDKHIYQVRYGLLMKDTQQRKHKSILISSNNLT